MGISYVLFALGFGLIISNVFKVPKMLKATGQTEFFVKIGLVCMGATIMFSTVLKAGAIGVTQALLVATTVWFMTYFICRKFCLWIFPEAENRCFNRTSPNGWPMLNRQVVKPES